MTREATDKLAMAVKRLEQNDDWKLVKAYLYYLAPPFDDAFNAKDECNPYAAAKRDGGSKLTRKIESLIIHEITDKEPPAVIADFKGDEP